MEQDDVNIHDKHSEICIIYVNTAHRLAELDVKLDQPMLGETDDEATPDEDDVTPTSRRSSDAEVC
jgi:hypothetical protein